MLILYNNIKLGEGVHKKEVYMNQVQKLMQ